MTRSHQYVDDIHNVLNISRRVPSQEGNGNSVTAVAMVVEEVDVCCRVVDRQAII